MSTPKPSGDQRPRNSSSSKRSSSTKRVQLQRSLGDRVQANRLARNARRATFLSTLPKQPLKRFLARMRPKNLAHYWFSTDGALMGLKIVGIGLVVMFVLTIGVFAYFRKDVTNITDIYGQNLGGSITYYDSSGETLLWQDYDAVKRLPVSASNMAPYIRQATVAIEDRNFYQEGAFNITAIGRAVLHDVTHAGGSLQGASTITQQLVKLNSPWVDKRTLGHKIQELILAVETSREYSKDDILTGYLNIAPYGGVEYGVEAAARDYFNTGAGKLTLAQASLLAAIPQAPGIYSPYNSPIYNKEITKDLFDREGLIGRQHYILDQMVAQRMITAKDASDAKAVDILAQIKPLSSKYLGIKAPWFVLTAKQELEQKYSTETVKRGGWKVLTTLNMDLQNKAEQLVATNNTRILGLTGGRADEEAMVAEDVQTGQIVALVGGTDFSNPDFGQNNYASGILIPPGSSFKPYDYTAFIDGNKTVGGGSVLYDQAGPLPGYSGLGGQPLLSDYDHRYPGPLTLRYALGGSRNVPAVKAMMSSVANDTSSGDVSSINNTIAVASKMMDKPSVTDAQRNIAPYQTTYNCYQDEALSIPKQCYGASAIGDGAFLHLDDHVNGLSTLARLGEAIPRTYISKINDAHNKTFYSYQRPAGTQVINKDTAYIVNDMASDARASYLPGSCTDTSCAGTSSTVSKFHRYNGWHFAIKTGTTNDAFDGLMTSWSTKYAVVSWVGNHTRRVTLPGFMETYTGPLVRGFMEYAHRNIPATNWQQPSDIKVLPAFVVRNKVSSNGEQVPSNATDLFPSWYTAPNASTSAQTIDKVSNKAATSCTPDAAKQTVTNANAGGFSVDKFISGGAQQAAASGTDDVHSCDDILPTITLTTPLVCPTTGCTITFTVTQGTHPLTDSDRSQFPGTVTISIDGKEATSVNVSDSPSSGSFTYIPTTTESGAKVVATVTDSVLYQATDQKTMDTITATPATPSSPVGH